MRDTPLVVVGRCGCLKHPCRPLLSGSMAGISAFHQPAQRGLIPVATTRGADASIVEHAGNGAQLDDTACLDLLDDGKHVGGEGRRIGTVGFPALVLC